VEENIHALRDDIQCFALMIYAFGDDMHGFAVICALSNVGVVVNRPYLKIAQKNGYDKNHSRVGLKTCALFIFAFFF
jgi:hypothetical protein